MRIRTCFTFFCIITLLAGGSCVSTKITVRAYDGPKRNPASLAFIEREDLQLIKQEKEYTLLTQVDSIPVTTGKQHVTPQRCDILPGTHTVEILHRQLQSPYFLGCYLVTFEAEAGKTYTIKANTDHTKRVVDIYVIDVSSQERIISTVDRKYILNNKD